MTALVSGNGVYWMPLEDIYAPQELDLRHARSQYLAATESVKSVLVSMVIDWAMSTHEDCMVLVTANTGAQLATTNCS